MTALVSGPLPLVGSAAVESARLFAAAPDPRVTADLDMHLNRFGPLPLADFPSGAGRRLLVEKVARARLRGRGGAGYPLAEKMLAVAEAKRGAVVVANGCEGDPSSAKDRALLHRAPHLVLDGIALAAHALGAREAVLALHTGSPLTAVLAAALSERVGDPVPVELAEMPTGFVASESTALINTLNTGDPARPACGRRRRACAAARRWCPTWRPSRTSPSSPASATTGTARRAPRARRGRCWRRSAAR